ncbi:hypothetical protein F0562_024101 [Nyssa sinensis]|uniref:Uncharacterized protein n=1 Tax=Nyssa sinensis TaxID=561372 RepID=A0A5J5BJI3_9ASTE|nr:hypothetical protein F0562_024101 [Nyssa sinensis]
MELGVVDDGDGGTDRWFVMVVGVVGVGHDGVAEGVGLEARLAVEMGDRAVMAVDLMGDDGVGRRWGYGGAVERRTLWASRDRGTGWGSVRRWLVGDDGLWRYGGSDVGSEGDGWSRGCAVVMVGMMMGVAVLLMDGGEGDGRCRLAVGGEGRCGGHGSDFGDGVAVGDWLWHWLWRYGRWSCGGYGCAGEVAVG